MRLVAGSGWTCCVLQKRMKRLIPVWYDCLVERARERGEASVAGVKLKGVEHARDLGGLSLCLWSKRKKFGELPAGDGIC